jgi:multidrug transporter EmrE-like cation transporter
MDGSIMEMKIEKLTAVLPLWLLLLIALATLELIGDTFAKQFALTGEIKNSLFAILFVVAGNLCWQHMLRQGVPLGTGGVLFGVSVALGMLVIGAVFYGESLTPMKLLGAGFGLVALVLLAL